MGPLRGSRLWWRHWRRWSAGLALALVMVTVCTWPPQQHEQRSECETVRPASAEVETRAQRGFSYAHVAQPPPDSFLELEPCLMHGQPHSPSEIALAKAMRHLWRPDSHALFDRALHMYAHMQPLDDRRKLWFLYGVTPNARGYDTLARIGGWYGALQNRTIFDVGCSKGGMLVAGASIGMVALGGVDVTEFDVKRNGYWNMIQNGLDPYMLHIGDVIDVAPRFRGRADLITCNAVIEHVPDVRAVLRAMVDMLSSHPQASISLEVPNPYHFDAVKSDGHYLLPGIVLLSFEEAKLVYSPNDAYYRCILHSDRLDRYECRALMRTLGLTCRVTNAPTSVTIAQAVEIVAQVNATLAPLRSGVLAYNHSVASLIMARAIEWAAEIRSYPLSTLHERVQFFELYGMPWWYIACKRL